MKEERFTFPSSDGKTGIDAVKWIPDDGEYRAIVQISHGMQEYIGRYRKFAEYLTEQGFLVAGHTHLGHGKSVTSMENLGFIADENPSNKMIADMHYLRTMIQKDNEDVPYFMLAHSMGSYLLRKYLTVYNTKLSGAIIVGTGYVPDLTTKLGMAACKCMAAFKGWHYRSKLVTDLSFGGAYNKFDKTGKNPERSWLSKNTESVKQYYSDPRCTFMFTLNGFYTLMETVYYDNQMKNIKKTPKSLPMFFISGDKDPVGDFGEGVKHVYHMYKAAGMENVDIKLYKDDRHEILNETDCDVVYDDIAEWIGRYIF